MPVTIEFPQAVTRGWIEKEGKTLLSKTYKEQLVLDLAKTIHIDSAGISLLFFLGRQCDKVGTKAILKNASKTIQDLINNAEIVTKLPELKNKKENIFAQIGDYILVSKEATTSGLSMLAEILYWASFGLLKKRDFRKGSFEQQMYLMGYKAIGIITLLSFLIGTVLALQAALQLNRFGAGIYLAAMMAILMMKELGPLLTAIILAGRSGSAITAEIATMVVGEEIDALRTMGLNPIQFTVVPKLYALSITMPVLSLFGTMVGIFGGYLVAVFYLNISSTLMIKELLGHIYIEDVIANVVKSTVFSWLIIWVGTFHGFRVRGGAESVGRETTQSVVSGIFIIILADALFSFIF